MEDYKRYVFMGIIITSLGVIFSTTLKEKTGALGTVMVAVGGLFLIIGMKKKRDGEE